MNSDKLALREAMASGPLTKPARGTALLDKHTRRAKVVTHEKRIMQQARKRDKGRCRLPACEFWSLPVDVCHEQHRGMGGNAKGDRTHLAGLICLCRKHHGQYDTGELTITALTLKGFSGVCQFRSHWREGVG
jgi:hypothetical protein